MDLVLFAIMLAIFESLVVIAARRWFPNEPYTVSVAPAITAIVMMRWGPWAGLHAALGGAVFCLVSGARPAHYAIYIIGNLFSLGALGLIKAVNTFRPETGAQLSSYAARCIENEILMLLRASKKRRGDVSLNDPVGTDKEGNDISFQDILGTAPGQVEDEVVRRVSLEKARRLVKELPRRERLVIEMRYGLLDGRMHPQHEVASALGISRSYVSRMEKRALETLREGMEKNG
jgi:RNA polymerase sigma factor (sigma-70 family)